MAIDELHEGLSGSLSADLDAVATRAPTVEPAAPIGDTADRPRRVAAERTGSLASAARHAARELEDQFPQAALYISDVAAGFEHVANLLRDPRLDNLSNLVGDIGRKQPAAVVAGFVVLGFGLAWLLKSPGEAGTHGLH